jgi:hypothetical protein
VLRLDQLVDHMAAAGDVELSFVHADDLGADPVRRRHHRPSEGAVLRHGGGSGKVPIRDQQAR